MVRLVVDSYMFQAQLCFHRKQMWRLHLSNENVAPLLLARDECG